MAQCSDYGQTFGSNLLIRADDQVRVVALPFAFPFNGTTYSFITVSSNGWIKLGASTSTSSDLGDTEALMLNSANEPRIAVCWDDLDPDTAPSGVFYAARPASVTVVWQNTPRFNNSTTIFANCECILDITGAITMNWDASCTFNLSTSSSIVGISKSNNSVLIGTHTFDWSAIAPNTPVVDATGYQLFTATPGTAPFDLNGAGGRSLTFIPDGSTVAVDDYVATFGPGLGACAPAAFPPTSSTTSTSIGAGCTATVPTNNPIFELFTINTGTSPVDLSNTSIWFSKVGNQYLTLPGIGFDSSYTATTGVTMLDDSLAVKPVGPMGSFALGVNAPVTQVAACSNGYIWLDAAATSAAYLPVEADFASLGQRIAPLWFDFNFSAAGNGLFYWNTGTNYLGTGLAYAQGTWENAREYNQTTGSATVQVTMVANGDVYFAYGAISGGIVRPALTGITGGAGSSTGSVNLVTGGVTNIIGPVAVTGGQPPITPMNHTVVPARLGQNFTLNSTCPASALFGIFGVGMANPNIPLDLLFGPGAAPGCFLYTDAGQDLFLSVPVTGTSFTLTPYAPVPAFLYLAGITAYTQAAAYVPGVNPASLLSSNGQTFTVGF